MAKDAAIRQRRAGKSDGWPLGSPAGHARSRWWWCPGFGHVSKTIHTSDWIRGVADRWSGACSACSAHPRRHRAGLAGGPLGPQGPHDPAGGLGRDTEP